MSCPHSLFELDPNTPCREIIVAPVMLNASAEPLAMEFDFNKKAGVQFIPGKFPAAGLIFLQFPFEGTRRQGRHRVQVADVARS